MWGAKVLGEIFEGRSEGKSGVISAGRLGVSADGFLACVGSKFR